MVVILAVERKDYTLVPRELHLHTGKHTHTDKLSDRTASLLIIFESIYINIKNKEETNNCYCIVITNFNDTLDPDQHENQFFKLDPDQHENQLFKLDQDSYPDPQPWH